MEYIENIGNRTRTYEITMDEERLKELMVLLDRDCYVERVGMRMLNAHDKEEAHKKIKNVANHDGILENIDFDNVYLTEGQGWYHGRPYEASYEAVYKDSVELVKMIQYILNYKDDNGELVQKYCLKYFEDIKKYKDSIDFVPFEGRVQIAENKLNEALLQLNKSDNKGLLELVKAYGNACIEAKLNRGYNFQRLAELYIKVLKCFKTTLVQEVIRYKTR